MKKTRLFAAAMAVILCLSLCINVYAMGEVVIANPTTSKVTVNGAAVPVMAYNINGNNFFKLRDLGMYADFGVSWDNTAQTIYIDTTASYTPDGSETKTASQNGYSVVAAVTAAKVLIDGTQKDFIAYNINGNNFFKLRDIGEAVNFGVEWDGTTNTVIIDTSVGYTSEVVPLDPDIPRVEVEGNASGDIYPIPITTKLVDGKDKSREDFSQQANPDIFDSVFTRGAYNALRQTVVDRDKIVADCDENTTVNPYYHYAHAVMSDDTRNAMKKVAQSISEYYRYVMKNESYVKEIYNYPGYRVFTVFNHSINDLANEATANTISKVKAMPTDAERVTYLNNYLCDKMTYDVNGTANASMTFTSTEPVGGGCVTYAFNFLYLCERAGIPCVVVNGDDHAWNLVYTDGAWKYVDVQLNDLSASRNAMLLTDTCRKTDENPQATAFSQEILVPASTK